MASNGGPTGYRRLAERGLALAVGLLLMAYSANTVFWYSYQRANPAVGEASTSFGFLALNALVFIAGTILAYVVFMRGLAAATNAA